jgi:hypothetical protein
MLLLTVFWKYGYSSTPNQSIASITALFDEFVHEFQVSTWPIETSANGVPFSAVLTCPIYLTIVAGSAPTPERFSIPVGETR